MDRKTAAAIGASVGAVVGVVSASVYFYNEIMSKSSTPTKEAIVTTLVLAPPVLGGAIGFYASQ